MENRPGTVPDTTFERSAGRILFDTITEGILNAVFFLLGFIAWCMQWTLATVVFLAIMAGAGYYVFTEALAGGYQVPVPRIVGRPITEASAMLQEQGLELGEQMQVFHSAVPRYHVIAQRPKAGQVVRTGHKVIPTVSLGEDYQTAPNLLKKQVEEAREEISLSRFGGGTVARIPHPTPRDTVIAQDPAPERAIPSYGDIHLLVSAGPEKRRYFMPDIRGMRVTEVEDFLASFAITLVPEEVDTPDVSLDVVLNQEPRPHTLVREAQVVRYQVKRSGMVKLPDSRHYAVVRHQMLFDWYDRSVRVEMVDWRGNRRTLETIPPSFDALSKARRAAGSVIRVPLTYIVEARVLIYMDETLAVSYYLKDGAQPIRYSDLNE